MSKELIERLRVFAGDPVLGSVADEAADHIEELERERDSAYKIADHYRSERDALQADNARLRELLRQWAFTHTDDEGAFMEVQEALAATPEQSLAALQADNARLREVLSHILRCIPINGFAQIHWDSATWADIDAALAATPEQSLARIRNQVREECAVICMGQCSVIEEPHEFERCRDAIRATKEPE